MPEKDNSLEKAVLVGLNSPTLSEEENADDGTLDELEELLRTAGGECVGRVIQNRRAPDPGTFIGEGKAAEIKEFMKANGVSLAVFDNSLSPSQTRALEKALDCRVIDRSALILDIFASRARTSEGKLQVELAQYEYLLPRLSGMWGHLVRQTASGGRSPIGTRGPGETQLETDRRHIREKIAKLKDELEDVRRVRATQRRSRSKAELPLAAIVGYTNAGKSTLLNALTGAGIEANNRLFDTLDPTTKILRVDGNRKILFSDTVGFIKKLPTLLVSAFKATLEELEYADVILHVIDASNPKWPEQAAVTDRLINELCREDTPRLRIFNKIDISGLSDIPVGSDVVPVSARTGEGLNALVDAVLSSLDRHRHELTLKIPYSDAATVDSLYRETDVKSLEYRDDCIEARIVCDTSVMGRYAHYAAIQSDTGADEIE